MLVLSIDVDLQRQFKVGLEAITRPDMFQTVEDFGSVVAGFLESELVARNSKNAEVLELALECIQCEVLRRRTSERRDIDDQYDVTDVVRPVDWRFVVYVVDLVIVDRTTAGERVIT